MSNRSDNGFIIYPVYFDKTVSKNFGRRLNKKYCTEKPTVNQLSKAAKAAGIHHSLESEKAHSAQPWKKDGRLIVAKKGSKQEILYKISKFL